MLDAGLFFKRWSWVGINVWVEGLMIGRTPFSIPWLFCLLNVLVG